LSNAAVRLANWRPSGPDGNPWSLVGQIPCRIASSASATNRCRSRDQLSGRSAMGSSTSCDRTSHRLGPQARGAVANEMLLRAGKRRRRCCTTMEPRTYRRPQCVQSSPCRPLVRAYARWLRVDTRFPATRGLRLACLNCASGTVSSISLWLLEIPSSRVGCRTAGRPRLTGCRTCD
jgi:hypothetical protein